MGCNARAAEITCSVKLVVNIKIYCSLRRLHCLFSLINLSYDFDCFFVVHAAQAAYIVNKSAFGILVYQRLFPTTPSNCERSVTGPVVTNLALVFAFAVCYCREHSETLCQYAHG